jgi:prophage antirepressor-like protein
MESTNKPGRENSQLVPFTFENRTVRTVVIKNEPWFVAKDVGEALGLSAIKTTLQGFPENEKGVHTMYLRSENGVQQSRKMLTVNEPGLYRLVFQSRKPEAEKFKTWVFTEVLPSIRRTGMFLPEGLGAMIRRTVTDVVTTMEREAVIKRGPSFWRTNGALSPSTPGIRYGTWRPLPARERLPSGGSSKPPNRNSHPCLKESRHEFERNRPAYQCHFRAYRRIRFR